MQLKNSDKSNISHDNIVISKEKLLDYLLSDSHPVGKSKSKYFNKHGFNKENYKLLQKGLRYLFEENDILEIFETEYGKKLIVDGEIITPIRTKLKIKTIWILSQEESEIRFVTAYPI